MQWVSAGFPVVERSSVGASLFGACLSRWICTTSSAPPFDTCDNDPLLNEDCIMLVQQSSTGSVFVQAIRVDDDERKPAPHQNKYYSMS